MEKYIYDKNNGLWYELQGDYYIPCLVLDEEDNQPMKTDDMKKAGDVLLADTSPASSGSLYSCELCSLPASYLHLSVSSAAHLRNSHSSNKLQIPANRRPKTL